MKAIKISAFIAGLLFVTMNSALAKPTVKETKEFITDRAERCGHFAIPSSAVIDRADRGLYMSGMNGYVLDISFVNDEAHMRQTYDVMKNVYGTVSKSYHESSIGITKLSDLLVTAKFLGHGSSLLTPTSTKPYIELECTSGSCWKVRISDRNKDLSDGDKVHSVNRWGVYMCDIDTAQRMTKAFNHLIKKSGGKVPLF